MKDKNNTNKIGAHLQIKGGFKRLNQIQSMVLDWISDWENRAIKDNWGEVNMDYIQIIVLQQWKMSQSSTSIGITQE